MLNYLIRRTLLIVPTLIGATLVMFFVMALSPVSVVTSLLSQEGNMRPGERQARIDYLNKRYGLDKPLPVQYLRWLNGISPIGVKEPGEGFPGAMKFGLKTPDLGHSFVKSRRVGPIILEALPVTLMLQAISLPLSYAIAIGAGVWMARHRGKTQDVATGTGLLALWSFPVILAAVLAIGYFANVNYFKWFPAGELHSPGADKMSFLPGSDGPGYLLDTLWHLVLPVICLTYANFAFIAKLTRASLLESLTQDYVRTARAKGLAERVVLLRHALRNSLLPLITVLAHILPAMISGSIIIEKVFSIPGMGRLVIDSLMSQDRELFLSVAVMTLLLQLVGFLISDILYAIVDPRISYE